MPNFQANEVNAQTHLRPLTHIRARASVIRSYPLSSAQLSTTNSKPPHPPLISNFSVKITKSAILIWYFQNNSLPLQPKFTLCVFYLYGPNGPDDITKGMIGLTMTSDYSTFGAIASDDYLVEWDYRGKRGKLKSNWKLSALDKNGEERWRIPEIDGNLNYSPQARKLW